MHIKAKGDAISQAPDRQIEQFYKYSWWKPDMRQLIYTAVVDVN